MNEIAIPKSINIGPYTFSVVWGETINGELDRAKCYGTTDSTNQTIRLDSAAMPQRISNTFIHEILEAISDPWTDNKLGHDMIDPIANALTQVFEQMGVRFVLRNE